MTNKESNLDKTSIFDNINDIKNESIVCSIFDEDLTKNSKSSVK
jgi:hypothetical protein